MISVNATASHRGLSGLDRGQRRMGIRGSYKQIVGAICLTFESPIGRTGSEAWNGDHGERITREIIMDRMKERAFPYFPREFAYEPRAQGGWGATW